MLYVKLSKVRTQLLHRRCGFHRKSPNLNCSISCPSPNNYFNRIISTACSSLFHFMLMAYSHFWSTNNQLLSPPPLSLPKRNAHLRGICICILPTKTTTTTITRIFFVNIDDLYPLYLWHCPQHRSDSSYTRPRSTDANKNGKADSTVSCRIDTSTSSSLSNFNCITFSQYIQERSKNSAKSSRYFLPIKTSKRGNKEYLPFCHLHPCWHHQSCCHHPRDCHHHFTIFFPVGESSSYWYNMYFCWFRWNSPSLTWTAS